MLSKTFKKETEYLHIPIFDEHPENFNYVKVFDGDRFIGEYHMGISVPKKGKETNFYVALYLGNFKGETVTLETDAEVDGDYFDGIIAGGHPLEEKELYPNLYKEPIRQRFHFSPMIGWQNDANGCFYKDGKFHLYYQHNPFGSHHGLVNVSWGHAITKDLVHFEEFHDAIMPYSSRCLVASGSSVVDENDISGKGKGTVIATYTALQSFQYQSRPKVTQNEGQMLLFSTDDGMNFNYFEKNPIITVPDGEEWRDPKIMIVDGKFCIIVYETFEGKNCASFYVSEGPENFELVSRSEDIYECPDMFPLTVSETGEELWVLYGGNGKYSIGTFENFKFKAIEKDLFVDYGGSLYAGQSFNSYPDNTHRYHIGWLVDHHQPCCMVDNSIFSGYGFQQAMSLICRLEIHKTDKGYRLFRTPNENLMKLRGEEEFVTLKHRKTVSSPSEYIFSLEGNEPVSIRFGAEGFDYDPKTRHIKSTSENKKTNGKEYTLSTDREAIVRMFVDKRSVEFFLSEEISLSYYALPETMPIEIRGREEIKAKKYNLKSIW